MCAFRLKMACGSIEHFFFPKNYTVSEWKKFLQGNQFRLRWCLSTQKLWQGSNEKPWIPITNNLSINVWHFILLLFQKVVASSPVSVIDVPSVHSIQLKIIKTDTEENRNRWNRITFIQKKIHRQQCYAITFDNMLHIFLSYLKHLFIRSQGESTV